MTSGGDHTELAGANRGGAGAIVDMLGIVYDRECWEAYLRRFARDAPSYLGLFGRRFAEMAGVDHEAYSSALQRGPHTAVDLLFGAGRIADDIAAHVEDMRRQGVLYQVIAGGADPLPGSPGENMNDRVSSHAAAHPDLLTAWAGVSLRDPEAAVAEARRGVLELGMTGVIVTHFLDDADPLSAGSHELYSACESLGVPIWIHTGHNFSRRASVGTCTWREIDDIARTHPELRVVAGHGGWPWVLEMVAVCQRHPNVLLELSTHRPKYMGRPGSGWEPLLLYGNSTVSDKVMFGSCEWTHGLSPRALAEEFAGLPLSGRALEQWLRGNAADLLEGVPYSARAAGREPAPTIARTSAT